MTSHGIWPLVCLPGLPNPDESEEQSAVCPAARPRGCREAAVPARGSAVTPSSPFQTLAGSCGKFAPFEIKEHMVLAPRFRTAFDQDLCDQLDQLLRQQNGEFSFLKDLKGRQPLRSGPTVVSNRNTDTCNRLVAGGTVVYLLVKSEHSWRGREGRGPGQSPGFCSAAGLALGHLSLSGRPMSSCSPACSGFAGSCCCGVRTPVLASRTLGAGILVPSVPASLGGRFPVLVGLLILHHPTCIDAVGQQLSNLVSPSSSALCPWSKCSLASLGPGGHPSP